MDTVLVSPLSSAVVSHATSAFLVHKRQDSELLIEDWSTVGPDPGPRGPGARGITPPIWHRGLAGL